MMISFGKAHGLEPRIVTRAIKTDIAAVEVVSDVGKICIKLTRVLAWGDVSFIGKWQDERDRHAVTS